MSENTGNFKKPFFEKEPRPFDSAMPEFMAHETFKGLIPQDANPQLLEQLGHRTAKAWWSNARPTWKPRVLTALELLRQVPSAHFAKLAEVMQIALHAYYGPQKLSYFTTKDRVSKKAAEEPEQRFPPLFQEYLHGFEEVYRCIATIFAFAKEATFGQTHAHNTASWWLDQSAKTKASKLDSPIVLGPLPVNTLTEGYHRHYRNAIAHCRHRFTGRESAEMWDVNEKGRETWRQIVDYPFCQNQLEQLEMTISVMEAAYFLFAMNQGASLARATSQLPRPTMSREQRHSLIYTLAKEVYNLEVIDLIDEKDRLQITVKIIPNFDIPQVSQVIVGHATGARRFDVEMKVEELLLKNVVFGFVRALRRNLGPMPGVTVNVRDENAGDAGNLVLEAAQVEFLNSANDKIVGVDDISVASNSLALINVKFTMRSAPRRSWPKPPLIITPPEKRIIVP